MANQESNPLADFLDLALRSPALGLAGDSADVAIQLDFFRKEAQILQTKQQNPELPLLISLEGGTGTGKSTIFNALLCHHLSKTGVERPKTQGPILYCHERQAHWFQDGVLLPEYAKHSLTVGGERTGASGDPQTIQVLYHQDPEWRELFLIDTPDVDSVTRINRGIAEDIYIVSDVICLITSQEKYGDDIPFQIFRQALAEGKSIFIVMNKMESRAAFEELEERVCQETPSPPPKERFFAVPWKEGASPEEALAEEPDLKRLRRTLLDRAPPLPQGAIRKLEIVALEDRLMAKAQRLLSLFDAERDHADQLAERFLTAHSQVEKDLIEKSSSAMDSARKEHLQTEIMRIFRRYDLLRKPRTFIARILTSPLTLLGYRQPPDSEKRRRTLGRVYRKMDLQPLHAAVHAYNRRIHEEITGLGREHLRKVLLKKDLLLTTEEIESSFFSKQTDLEAWLEAKFTEMARGISKSKEWGIYSTTLLWGLFLVTVESVVGGGLTLFDAVLDSFIMPFISKGTAELFAYQELKRIGQELDRRYKGQLSSVLRMQHDRYQGVLDDTSLSRENLELMKKHVADMRHRVKNLRI